MTSTIDDTRPEPSAEALEFAKFVGDGEPIPCSAIDCPGWAVTGSLYYVSPSTATQCYPCSEHLDLFYAMEDESRERWRT